MRSLKDKKWWRKFGSLSPGSRIRDPGDAKPWGRQWLRCVATRDEEAMF